MALSEVTVTFNLTQLLGETFDARRTRAYVKTNVANGTLMDTSTGEIRLGDQKVTVGDDGTGSFTTWAPGVDGNPTSWQTSLVVEYPRTGQRDRQVRTFGPYTITASADLADLEEEQAVPAEYLTQVTDELQTYSDAAASSATAAQTARTGAEAARDEAQALVLSDLGTTDGQTAALIDNPLSQTASSLSASTAAQIGTEIETDDTPGQVAVARRIEEGTPTSEGFALRMAMESGQPVVTIVQGDSTGNAPDEWPYLVQQALIADYPAVRALHRVYNQTTLAYDPPTVVQAGTEGYYTVSATDVVALNDVNAVPIAGDLTVRLKVRSTDVDQAVRRMLAAKWGGVAGEQSFWFYIDATNGLTLGWQETGGAFRSAVLASMAQLSAAFTDNTDFFIGFELDVDNGAGQYGVRGLTSADGTTWSTLGTPVVGATGVSSVKVGTGYLKPGGRGNAAGNTDPWNGRIYWMEVCSGLHAASSIKARFEPGLALNHVSSWFGAEGHSWVKGTTGALIPGSQLVLMLNASSPGEDAGFSVTNFATQAAIQPTLAILSYGYNGQPSSVIPDYAATSYKPLLDAWTSTWPNVPVMVTLQGPQTAPRTTAQIEDHKRRLRGVARLAASQRRPIIDAYTPLAADTATYVQGDGVHPTAAGSLVWAEAVRQALRPAISA